MLVPALGPPCRGLIVPTLECPSYRGKPKDAKEEAVRAEARAELAWQVAKAPPPAGSLEKPRLNAEQDQKLVELIQRADSFNDAYVMIEDVPEEGVRDERWRRIILGVLAEAKSAFQNPDVV